MATLMIERDLTGFAPVDYTFNCYDDDTFDGPDSTVGFGATEVAAVEAYLAEITDEDLAHLAWSVRAFGENAAWHKEIEAEILSRKEAA